MKKIILSLLSLVMTITMQAVPAYPGWQTKTQPDGTTIEVRLVGDEFYHYWETSDGKLAVEQADGLFVKSNEPLPTKDEFQLRRDKARELKVGEPDNGSHKLKKVGTTPNLAPKGVVILVNFSNKSMKSGHTRSVFDNMCNATSGNCTTNAYNGKNYGSAAQYFEDQSNGSYRPDFDVFGPVTLPNTVKYYGEEGERNGKTENDLYMADFVIDAVLAADEAGCDFSKYDSDGDGWVDFVYFIFAGKGQAYGGSSETIWPHNWNLVSALYYGQTHGTSEYYNNGGYDYNLPKLDGKFINNYACSAELDGYSNLGGIGTLCHEFGHVMGLPDLYDIEYGTIYEQGLIPGEWDIMSGGSYNGGMHCPPNYDPWEKAFFGWVDPINLGNTPSSRTLYPNGSSSYNVYQVTKSGYALGPTDSGERYYLEYRQQSGWDEFLPGHGFVAWRVDYDADIWSRNAPNASSTSGAPRFTVDAYGVSSWNSVSGKTVTDIKESGGKVTFKYNGGEDNPSDPDWEGWNYYDNGEQATCIGKGGGDFYWSVMFPAYSQSQDKLTKVAVYESAKYNTQPITITIYSGGNLPTNGDQLYSQTFNPTGQNGFHVITLTTPVMFDVKKNLWIVLNAIPDDYPASASIDTGDPNGRWYSNDGSNWKDLADIGLNYTFMVRAYMENSSSSDRWTEWAYYDDGTHVTGIGTNGGEFYWGVMFPAYSMENNKLSKVAIYETPRSNTQPIIITVYSGGDMPKTGNRIYSETVAPSGAEGFHVIEFQLPVIFNKNKNLWITLQEGSDEYPGLVSADTGNPNGRWYSVNGTDWKDLADIGLNYTFMVRAYIGDANGIENVLEDIEGHHKVIHDGQLYIIRGGKVYNASGIRLK